MNFRRIVAVSLLCAASFATAGSIARAQSARPEESPSASAPLAPQASPSPADSTTASPPEAPKADEATPHAPAQRSPAARIGKSSKVAQCRSDARAKGLRGEDSFDYIQVCVEKARLACLEDAIKNRVGRDTRRDYIAKCIRG
jgi:hypothetical protein